MSLSPPPLLLLLLPFPWMGKSVVKSSSVLSQITRKIPTKKKQGNAFLSSLDKKKELSIKNRISIDRSLDYVSGRRRSSRRGERFSFSLSVCLCVCVCVCVCARDRSSNFLQYLRREKERARRHLLPRD